MSNYEIFVNAFNLPIKDSSKNDQGEEYADIRESEGEFSDLAKKMNEDLKNIAHKNKILNIETFPIKEPISSDISDISTNENIKIEETMSSPSDNMIYDKIEENKEIIIEEIKEEAPIKNTLVEISEIIVGDIVETEIIEKNIQNDIKEENGSGEEREKDEEEKEDEQKEDIENINFDVEINEKEKTPVDDEGIYVEVKTDYSCIHIPYEKDIPWRMKSPSSMWDRFYSQKVQTVKNCMVKGELDFDLLADELSQTTIDIAAETFDKDEIMKQMEKVQLFRERVKLISIRVNAQYFLFKRFYALLEGHLASTLYVKPQVKQGGLMIEHLGDIGLYLGKLEGIYESVKKTEDVLKNCYDTLSRKVTICMELKLREIYEKTDFTGSSGRHYSASNADIEVEMKPKPILHYDRIVDGSEAKKIKNNEGGVISWTDV